MIAKTANRADGICFHKTDLAPYLRRGARLASRREHRACASSFYVRCVDAAYQRIGMYVSISVDK